MLLGGGRQTEMHLMTTRKTWRGHDGSRACLKH